MIELLRRLNPELVGFEESPVEVEGQVLAWQSTAVLKSGRPLASGFRRTRDEARRVACAEFIERSFMLRTAQEDLAGWALDKYPSACGLAAGFEREKTCMRSIVEAVERWVMTRWILGQQAILEVQPCLGELERHLLKDFSELKAFKVTVPVKIFDQFVLVHVAILLAFTTQGVFPGSNATTDIDELWAHAAVEVYRHWRTYKNGVDWKIFPYDRLFYFAEHRDAALSQIPKPAVADWPIPESVFFREHEIEDGIFVARTIMKGFTSWVDGPTDQFLY